MKLIFLSLFCLCTFVLQAQPVQNRNSIINYLKQKVEKGEPLVAHVLVPLCDNEHQGIVPTSEAIGNGMDPDHNLYWMTSKGIKRYFKELPDWKMLESTKNIDDDILERVIFKKKFSNGATVILVADAYRGDRMHQCLNDYFNSLSGNLKDSVKVDSVFLQINGNADLIAFSGHNGLMDETTNYQVANDDTKIKDAVSISCASSGYFKKYYLDTKSYPLVHTTNLLYPGAFILEGILNKWALLETDEQCKIAAGKAYYTHKPKSGPNGSQNLFNFGW